jgi:inhibitor of KinA
VNETAIALARVIQTAALPGVRDVVPTYRSVAIHFDPLRTRYDVLVGRVNTWMGDAFLGRSEAGPPYADPSPVRVPVCYEGGFAPDLADVAAFAAVSGTEAVRLHTSRIYRVFMLGFMPGFAYMGIVDAQIAAPRLPTPRVRIPAGSVGIAGMQTGIYPVSTPGGWRIIGRTPLKPFDLSRREPALFKPGDAVQFYAIDPDEYARFESGR